MSSTVESKVAGYKENISTEDVVEFFDTPEEVDYFNEKLERFAEDELFLEEENNKTASEVDEWNNDVVKEYAKDEEEWVRKNSEDGTDIDILRHEVESQPAGSPEKKGASPKAHKFSNRMTTLAAGGLAFVGIMMVMSAVCAGGYCLTENGDNIPLMILESELMLVLVSVIIGPVFAKILREKYDIQITDEQINMIMKDGLSAVKMYSTEAKKLRDPITGKIPDGKQKQLRNLAFMSLKSNYEPEKYRDLISSVGVQVFERAIERAVEDEKFKNFPLEKQQVLAIVGQALDTIPEIVEWKDLDNNVKDAFIEGHVKRLLSNAGVEGWGHKALEGVFDAEVNKRILAAAVADQKNLLDKLDKENKHLRYTSVVLNAVGESITKTKDN